jgi:tetratricopeptide (TPR) repeat protein
MERKSVIDLQERPESLLCQPVAAWNEPVVIPTYPVLAADRNPMFLEKRVYQGSSGRVYPNPVIDRVSDERTDQTWAALHLENEYVRLMVLPEIGGRIHVGLDRTNGYDFFYRQNVIKPALVGLLGPWISGGVEFNWPQHHRPSSFMPVDWAIEDLPDGGRTIWCSEHEPMGRMKGMHGVTLRPNSSVVELRVRLFNRTAIVNTFLWWANVCARVHDRYQSFFPPDVRYVFDHAKRAVSTFPIAHGHYYGVDYGSRRPAEADLSWYHNIPVPTSYMATGTQGEFFGGYDHAADAGFVHWADHRISPGKKQWTWGNSQFGYAWDRELTDADGPYVELMAGVYTDNQPDFSFLMPYETKTFSQYWYPIQRIGLAHAANLDGALHLTVRDGLARIGTAVTRDRPNATVRLLIGEELVWERTSDLAPGQPLVVEDVPLPAGTEATSLRLSVCADGRELVVYRPEQVAAGEAPRPAREPALPADISSSEELYLTGLHLAQYRHATRHAEDYWREALRRRPGDARSNTAMGWWHLSRGEFQVAASHFKTAIATLTQLNPNPYDGEPLYGLGLALRYANRLEDADNTLAKAAWSDPWCGPAAFARAQLAARQGEFETAVNLLDRVIDGNRDLAAARSLRAAILRRIGRPAEARTDIQAVLGADPLDAVALDQRRRLATEGEWPDDTQVVVGPSVNGPLPGGVQTALDVAHDYAAAGLLDEAMEVLRRQISVGSAKSVQPMVRYTLAWLQSRADDPEAAAEFRQASVMSPEYCFPARLEEIEILRTAMALRPEDARAPYYLGNLLYDRRRYEDAIDLWRQAAQLDPSFPTVHRNLGLAEFNALGRPEEALACYRQALDADPSDTRVLYEFDQLRRRCGDAPAKRIRLLDENRRLVEHRDDLTIEHVTLLNLLGRHEEALAVLGTRRFHPWEGGEGLVSGQWVLANLRLAQVALDSSDPDCAIRCLEAALERPQNLGEGKHPLATENEVHFHLALALLAAGRETDATAWLASAAAPQGDARAPLGEPTYWQARALRALGDEDGATDLFERLLQSARQRAAQPQTIDYFATSLPTFLVFEDDLDHRNRVECRYLEALALSGLGQYDTATHLLSEVLELDISHSGARWHLQAIAADLG